MPIIPDEFIAAVEQWHNYKQRMKYDTEPRVRPDGTIVPVVNVGHFQDVMNDATARFIRALGSSDEEFITSLMELAASAKSTVHADKERARNSIRGLFGKNNG